MDLVELDAVQLDGEAARIADDEFFLGGEVWYNGVELDDATAELETRFHAFSATQQRCTTAALSYSKHQLALIVFLSQPTTQTVGHSVNQDYIATSTKCLQQKDYY